jgi:hypothetical protein
MREHLGCGLPPRLILEINVGELLAVLVADDEAGVPRLARFVLGARCCWCRWAPRFIHCGYYQRGSCKIAFVWIAVQVTKRHVRFLTHRHPGGVQLVFVPLPVNWRLKLTASETPATNPMHNGLLGPVAFRGSHQVISNCHQRKNRRDIGRSPAWWPRTTRRRRELIAPECPLEFV